MKPRTIILDTPERRARAVQAVQAIGDRPKMECVIRQYRPRRSLAQNDKIHSMFAEFGKHLGYSTEETKGIVKFKLGVKHTSNLSKMDMMDFIEQVYALGVEWGVEWAEDYRT